MMSFFNFFKRKGVIQEEEFDPTALIYALKTIKIDDDELLEINRNAHSILSSISVEEKGLVDEIEKIEDKGNKLYASIQIVSEAADVLIDYSKNSTESIKNSVKEFDQVINQLNIFTSGSSQILDIVKPFNNYSKHIGQITEIIIGIAQMTESAARNAGIKSYHAGESGRGFEVIADRMLLLANKTFNLTKRIPESINIIKIKTENVIESVDNVKFRIDALKKNIDLLNFRLKNVEMNLSDIVLKSDKMKEYIDIQDKNKNLINDLNKSVQNIIDVSLQSTEKLLTMVKTQSDVKVGLSNLMQQLEPLADLIYEKKSLDSSISTEIKIFKKIEFFIENSKNIIDQTMGVINEFIEKNDEQSKVVKNYFGAIESIEESEQLMLKNVGEIEDNLHLLLGAVNEFSTSVINVKNDIEKTLEMILNLKDDFSEISKNLKSIFETSLELKELSEQTKLLSLYASIEAARSGKYQQNLVVIVSQTKELIKKATDASLEIKDIVKNMEKLLHDVLSIVDKELDSAEKIIFSIETSNKVVKDVKDSAENFKNLLKEIYDTITQQEVLKDEIVKLYMNIISKSEKINQMANELNKIFKNDILKSEESLKMVSGIQETFSEKFIIKRDPEKNKFKFIMNNLPVHWQPALVGDSTSNTVLQQIHVGLVRFGKDTNVIPALAKYWHINSDATEWVFFLRKNAYFHDGTPVTAEDVKESIKNVLLTPNAPFVNMIKGAQNYIKRRARDVEGIEILDEHTIKFSLEYPYIPFLSNLAVICLAVVKKDMVKFSDEKMKNNCIGCGPFVLKYVDDERILMESNKYYFGGEPFVESVEIKIKREEDEFEELLAKKIDYCSVNAEDLEKLKKQNRIDIKVLTIPSLDVQYVGFNMSRKNEITLTKEIRKAINYATDKSRYINETMFGLGIISKGVFPPSLPCYNKSLEGYPYNLAKAKELMLKAGFSDGIKHNFEMICSNSERVIKRAELLQNMWQEIGIRIKIVPLKWVELLDRMHSGKCDLFMMGWAGDTGEPDNFLYPLFHSESFGDGGNNSFYSNKQVDDLILKARMTTNFEERNKLYQEIEKIIVDDAPWVFLTHNYRQIAIHDDVHGFYAHPLSVLPIEFTWKEI
ncbi:MAG: ABC transporter substrate-binding protein [candidate division WOR-3 bacterium]